MHCKFVPAYFDDGGFLVVRKFSNSAQVHVSIAWIPYQYKCIIRSPTLL